MVRAGGTSSRRRCRKRRCPRVQHRKVKGFRGSSRITIYHRHRTWRRTEYEARKKISRRHNKPSKSETQQASRIASFFVSATLSLAGGLFLIGIGASTGDVAVIAIAIATFAGGIALLFAGALFRRRRFTKLPKYGVLNTVSWQYKELKDQNLASNNTNGQIFIQPDKIYLRNDLCKVDAVSRR